MKNILLIIDPQNDFITGSLAVQGAKEKMLKLSDYVQEHGSNYDYIVITMDTHPSTHCSFKENGGIWPAHCVSFTNGWHMPEYLSDALKQHTQLFIYHKGDLDHKEEYSIFHNEVCAEILTKQLKELQEKDPMLMIDVCGIAGDYCVLETLKGLCDRVDPSKISVLTNFIASIDGGKALNEFTKSKNIKEIN